MILVWKELLNYPIISIKRVGRINSEDYKYNFKSKKANMKRNNIDLPSWSLKIEAKN